MEASASTATDSTSISPATVLPAVAPPPDGGADAESRKLPSSRYKGVVPQPNGRWGAQIYEKHQRVWLGTFNEEQEAATVYDVAARRFRGRDAVTNFAAAAVGEDEVEANFLTSHSKAEIVDMLRKHTYGDELEQCRRRRDSDGGRGRRHPSAAADPMAAQAREQLFEKMVTPSDVGKLNRLVIPKQYAERHFPLPATATTTTVGGGGGGNGTTTTTTTGVLLNFEDEGGRVWRFRYSYWNSSQSYVLTKGWSRFVKEKGMVSGDVVRFWRSSGGGDDRQLYIECVGRGRGEGQPVVRLFGVDIFSVRVTDSCGFKGAGNKKRGREGDEGELRCKEEVEW